MNIPVAKPFLEKEDAQAAYDTIMTQWVTQGPRVAEFETKFANYVGANYAVAVSNCTTALHLAMIVAGIERGDEVICPSLSYIATANSILYMGAKAIFAEVAPGTYNIDPIHVETLITPKTKAILIVHQVGMPADIDAFKALCNKYNLILIEDAACAAGSSYKGGKIGSHSDLVCFSFHPRKVITTGDGGMITTNNPQYYERLKLLRQHGMSVNDRVRHESKTVIIEEHLEVGYNYRMTDFQAAVGIKQLEKLDWIINERRKIAFKYLEAFKNIPNILLPIEDAHSFTNYQTFWIYLKENCKIKRNDLMQKLLDLGIATRKGVMTSHREKAYTRIGYNLSLPISEDMSDNSIVIPLFVPMSDEEQNYVIEKVLEYLA
jgi:dTDP-4-amino-4,6-dideoxygalactose transaminase